MHAYEPDPLHERLDDGDSLERRNDEQLEVQLGEQLQAELGCFGVGPSEGFVDGDESERA